jgi:hypothetical protein
VRKLDAPPTKKSRVYAAMPQAYAEASDQGRLPALARNIAYSLRTITGLGDELKLDYLLKGNQQGLINRYTEDHPDETAAWDVLRDARGSIAEPHIGTKVPLGTREVRDYLELQRDYLELASDEQDDTEAPELSLGWWTSGPKDRFGAVLYIEKEGFSELLEADRIAARFDLAVMSCKGYSVRAGRKLLVAWAREHPDVKVLVAHDFDKQGIGIFDLIAAEVPGAIDLGLRLDDIEDPRWQLSGKAESVSYSSDPQHNLAQHGASRDEISFLRTSPKAGKRVELNAFVGRRIIDWLEAKFDQHGVEKVIPDAETLEASFRRAYRRVCLNEAIAAAADEATEAALEADVPDDLADRIEHLFDNGWRELAWDSAIAHLARQARQDEILDG